MTGFGYIVATPSHSSSAVKSCQVTKIQGRYERLSLFEGSYPSSEVECIQEVVVTIVSEKCPTQIEDISLNIVSDYLKAIEDADVERMAALQTEDFTLDFVHHDAFVQEPFKKEEAIAFWAAWFSAFPEMDLHVTRTIVADPLVVTEWVFTGTHAGSLGAPVFENSIPPTGKTIRFRGVTIYELDRGQIRSVQMYLDMATVLVELGTTL
jgi:steroid delta-isomerase-like uncharacterized protein